MENRTMEIASWKDAKEWLTKKESDETVKESDGYVRLRTRINGEYVVVEVLASFAGNFQPNEVLLTKAETLSLIKSLCDHLQKV